MESYPLGDAGAGGTSLCRLHYGVGSVTSPAWVRPRSPQSCFPGKQRAFGSRSMSAENYESLREGQVLVRVTGWGLDRITCFVNFESNLGNVTNSQLIYLKDLATATETLFPRTTKMKFKRG